MLQQRLYSNSAAWRKGYIFTASALRRTVLEDLPGSVHKLSVSHLPWAADLLWFYFPLGFLPPPLGDLYASTVCAPYACHEQTIRAVVQRHPHLLLPWAWAWPCNSLRAGSGVQQRHAGPQSVAKASYTSGHNSPYLRTAAGHLNSMASLNHLINQLVIWLFPHK